MKWFICILPLFFCLSSLAQKSLDKSGLNAFFDSLDRNAKAMGSVSVFYQEKEVYQRTIGFSDIVENTTSSETTKFRIGSVSNTFTAVIILQIIEERNLSLESRLSNYFPKIPLADYITIKQLLQHQSGLADYTAAKDYSEWMQNGISNDYLLKKIIKNGNQSPPGKNTSYSNTNYLLLSWIAEKIDGRKFADILRVRIVGKAGLSDTRIGARIKSHHGEAISYEKLYDWVVSTETDMTVTQGCGNIISTPTDLNRFYQALFNFKLITEESVKMMTDWEDDFGMGVFKINTSVKKGVGHSGGIDGFYTQVIHFDKEKITVAYTTNGIDYPTQNIMEGILSLVFGKRFEMPTFTPKYSLNTTDLDIYLGRYRSVDFPIKMYVSKKGNILVAEATGVSPFPLIPYEEDKFEFQRADIKVDFYPKEDKLILHQGKKSFELLKDY